MLEPRWRSGGMLPGDSNRDRVTLDQGRSCLMPNLPGLTQTGMTFSPITKGKGELLCFTPWGNFYGFFKLHYCQLPCIIAEKFVKYQ